MLNVVGGVRVEETASDVPLVLAMLSSYKNRPIDRRVIAFGEIGLTGEVRPVPSGQERLNEAVKQGFVKAIVPFDNAPSRPIAGLDVVKIKKVSDLLTVI